MSRRLLSAAIAAMAAGAILPATQAAAAQAQTVRISIDNAGVQGNDHSGAVQLSADGRYAAFDSRANNLVPGDTNKARDVFVHDRQARTVQRVSVSSLGVEGNGNSGFAGGGGSCQRLAISADGRFVAFESAASNLVAGDTNNNADVFVHDRLTGQTERVSLDSAGAQLTGGSSSPAISADGRFVAFETGSAAVPEDTGASDIYVRDRLSATTERISVGLGGANPNGGSSCSTVSADGRFVGFRSLASNLVAGDTNLALDVFVRDRANQTTMRASVGSAGEQGMGASDTPWLSGDGTTLVFSSDATNLVAGDGNGFRDVFTRHLPSGATQRISLAVNGAEAIGSVSTPLGIDHSGRYVVFRSAAANVVPGDTNAAVDAFVKDLATGMVHRVNIGPGGAQSAGQGVILSGAISASGRVVAFSTPSPDLVVGDTNEVEDVFLRELPTFPYEYAAKVVCGMQTDAKDQRLAPGLYATTVNIHAPRGGTELFKKLALAIPPDKQTPGRIHPMAQHVLQYDEALAVGCTNLRDEVFGGNLPARFIDGFLVVQSTDSLDVVAVYSTAAIDAQGQVGPHSSIDVQKVAERQRKAALSVSKSGRYFCDAEPQATECVLVAALYTVTVRNEGAVDAADLVIDDVVSRSDGLPLAVVLPAPLDLPVGAVFEQTGPASLRVRLATLPTGAQAVVRFWALSVVSPGYQPDQLINRVEVNAANAEATVGATVAQSFD